MIPKPIYPVNYKNTWTDKESVYKKLCNKTSGLVLLHRAFNP